MVQVRLLRSTGISYDRCALAILQKPRCAIRDLNHSIMPGSWLRRSRVEHSKAERSLSMVTA